MWKQSKNKSAQQQVNKCVGRLSDRLYVATVNLSTKRVISQLSYTLIKKHHTTF